MCNVADNLCVSFLACCGLRMACDQLSPKNRKILAVVMGVAFSVIFASLFIQQLTTPYRNFSAMVTYAALTGLAFVYTLLAYNTMREQP